MISDTEPILPLQWLREINLDGESILPDAVGNLWYWCQTEFKWKPHTQELRDKLAVIGVDVRGVAMFEKIGPHFYPHTWQGFRCTPEGWELIKTYEANSHTAVKCPFPKVDHN